MEKKVRITIGQGLKKKLDWQILEEVKDYDSHIWDLVLTLEAMLEAREKHPKHYDKFFKLFSKRRRAFLKKWPDKDRHSLIRV